MGVFHVFQIVHIMAPNRAKHHKYKAQVFTWITAMFARPQRKNKGKNISLFDYNDYNKASNKNIKYGVWDQLRNNESQKQYQMYLLSLWTVTLESFKVSFCIALFKFEYALWSDGYTPANTWNIKNKFSR